MTKRNYFKLFKVVSIVACLALIFSQSAFAANKNFDYKVDSKFTDVNEKDWFYEAVSKCEDMGLIQGYGDGTFGPNDPITMQQVCVICERCIILHSSEDGTIDQSILAANDFNSDFTQPIVNAEYWELVPESHFSGEIGSRFEVFKDYAQNAYREEALSCFYRSYNSNNFDNYIDGYYRRTGKTRPTYNQNPMIPDYNDIRDVFKSDIYEAYKLGFASGYDSSGNFKPQNEITRAEFCQMIFNSGIVEMEHARFYMDW